MMPLPLATLLFAKTSHSVYPGNVFVKAFAILGVLFRLQHQARISAVPARHWRNVLPVGTRRRCYRLRNL